MRARRWSAEEDATLRTLRVQGASFKAIAQTLGRTEASVTNRMAETGFAGPRTSGDDALWDLWCRADAARRVA